ncbi:NAD(P)H-dependent oxidoreductase [Paenibacillus chitinolyticus]
MTTQAPSRVLIIQGHPDRESYCSALAESYRKGAAAAGAEIRFVQISDLDFNPNLAYGYRKRTELEPDLLGIQESIRWANHVVFVYPTWWWTMPALLKGMIDRVFLSGFAFKYKSKDSITWDKLLKGKSARLIVTMDTPVWYYQTIGGSPGHKAMKKGTLEFSGFKPVRVTTLGSLKLSTADKRKSWLNKAEKLGRKLI